MNQPRIGEQGSLPKVKVNHLIYVADGTTRISPWTFTAGPSFVVHQIVQNLTTWIIPTIRPPDRRPTESLIPFVPPPPPGGSHHILVYSILKWSHSAMAITSNRHQHHPRHHHHHHLNPIPSRFMILWHKSRPAASSVVNRSEQPTAAVSL